MGRGAKSLLALMLLAGLCLCTSHRAYAGTVTLRPSADPATPNWQTYPTNGQSRWSIINRSDLGVGTWLCIASGNVNDLYDLTDASVGQGATSMTIRAYTYMGSATLLATSLIALNADIGGSLVGTTSTQNPPSTIGLLNSCTGAGGNYDWRTVTYNGTWTQSQINSLKIYLGRQNGLLTGPIRVSQAEVQITYTDPPTVDQSAYRFYQNANSTTPAAALAATNTPSDVANSTPFRVRIGETVSSTAWSANYSSQKLQFTAKNQTTCAASTGWADVQSGSGVIQWYDNASPASGAAISSYASDPTVTGTATYEQYLEANSTTNPNAIAIGNTGLWDASLQSVGGTPGSTYCLRLVNGPGDFTPTYTQYPEFTLTGSLSIDMVDGSGASVTSPTISFGSVFAQLTCQASTATFGTSSQKLRINNDLSTTGWTASIAATSGPTALWQSAVGSKFYDYNDSSGTTAGCSDGADADTYAGQLSLSPAAATVTPKSGCSNTGVTLGSNTAFVEGTTDSISLINGSSGASRFCYWDVTGIGMLQRIPAQQATGTYSLNLTVTILAQ